MVDLPVHEGMCRLGILGGVGPGPTAHLYLELVRRCVAKTDAYPSIIVDSIRFPISIQQAFVQGQAHQGTRDQMTQILEQSIDRLCAAGIDLVALPCNTLHVLLEPIVAQRNLPLLHVVGVVMQQAGQAGFHRIGILGTDTTRRSQIYEHYAAQYGIAVSYPTDADQQQLNHVIQHLIINPNNRSALETLGLIIDRMAPQVDVVVLACTDLFNAAVNLVASVPVIDSLECLIHACAEYLLAAERVAYESK